MRKVIRETEQILNKSQDEGSKDVLMRLKTVQKEAGKSKKVSKEDEDADEDP